MTFITITPLLQRTFVKLIKEDQPFTPFFYSYAFCKEAYVSAIIIEDFNQIEKFTKNLYQSLQDELEQYRVKTLNELVTFFIAKLNRTNPAESNSQNTALNALLKRILQTIASMHNAQISALSTKSIKDLELVTNAAQIEKIKDNWIDFLTTYDDSFFDLLRPFGKVNKQDIKSTIENLNRRGSSSEGEGEYQNLALLFIASFTPSIASSVNEELAKISEEIRANPQSLNSESMMLSI